MLKYIFLCFSLYLNMQAYCSNMCAESMVYSQFYDIDYKEVKYKKFKSVVLEEINFIISQIKTYNSSTALISTKYIKAYYATYRQCYYVIMDDIYKDLSKALLAESMTISAIAEAFIEVLEKYKSDKVLKKYFEINKNLFETVSFDDFQDGFSLEIHNVLWNYYSLLK